MTDWCQISKHKYRYSHWIYKLLCSSDIILKESWGLKNIRIVEIFIPLGRDSYELLFFVLHPNTLLYMDMNMNVSYEISQEQEQEAPHIFHNIFKRSSFRNQNIYSTEGCTVWHIFPSWKIGIGIEESSVLICIIHYQCCEINFHISLNKLLENRLSFRKVNGIIKGKNSALYINLIYL